MNTVGATPPNTRNGPKVGDEAMKSGADDKTPQDATVRPGSVVNICSWRAPKVSSAVVIRTFTNGAIRAVPMNTEIGKQVKAAADAGDVTTLKPLAAEIEKAGFTFLATEYSQYER